MIKLGTIEIEEREIAVQGNAILGIRETGKSYTATLMAEQFLEAGIPFIAFDPIGIWKNLKIPGHGRGGKGFPIVVAGEDGDLPLTIESAPKIVEAAMTHGIPLVVDLYSMQLNKSDWRTIVEKCVRLLLYKNKKYGLRHIFIEEAPEFVPQRIGPGEGKVYAEIEKLVRMGGNASLGVTLISQRSEELNKAVLELCNLLILHRQRGRNSLTALEKWLRYSSGDSKDIAQQIPTLAKGECFIWQGEDSPPMRTQIQKKKSYHPDRRNPDVSKETKTSQVDAGKFVSMISEALKEDEKPVERLTPRNDAKTISYYEGRLRDALSGQDRVNQTLDSLRSRHCEELVELKQSIAKIIQRIELFQSMVPPKPEIRVRENHFLKDPTYETALEALEKHKLSKCAREVLRAAIQRHPQTSSKVQLAVLAKYSVNSSSFDNALSELRTAGMIDGRGNVIATTPAGMAEIKDIPPLPKGAELLKVWQGKLDRAARIILEVIVKEEEAQARHKLERRGIEKRDIAEASGYSENSSSFDNALSKLRSLELITRSNPIKAIPELLDV